MEPECDDGSREYKRSLVNITRQKLENVGSQMVFRIHEGHGEAQYVIGVDDDGSFVGLTDSDLAETHNNLMQAAVQNQLTLRTLQTTQVAEGLKIREYLVRKKLPNRIPPNLKVISLGQVDSGKSTTLATLCFNIVDNAKGSARDMLTRYPHEIVSGRTSTVSQHIVGFDKEGHVITTKVNDHKRRSWADICRLSVKLVTLFDLPGHERYFKTNVRQVHTIRPDIALITCAANKPLQRMMLQHLHLALLTNLPFVIVITKSDLITSNRKGVFTHLMEQIKQLCKTTLCSRIMINIRKDEDILLCARKIHHATIVPIFKVCNVAPQSGHAQLLRFLDLCPRQTYVDDETESKITASPRMQVEQTYCVRGIGLVLCGQLVAGHIRIGDSVKVGPFSNGSWEHGIVKSIHVKRVPAQIVATPHTCVCVVLKGKMFKPANRHLFTGQYLVSVSDNGIVPIKQFQAEITIANSGNSQTMRVGHEPIMFVHHQRIQLQLKNILIPHNQAHLSPGTIATVIFTVIQNCRFAGYFIPGDKFTLGSSCIRASGTVISITAG